MATIRTNLKRRGPVLSRSGFLALLVLLSFGLASPVSVFAGKKKKDAAAAEGAAGHRLFQHRLAEPAGYRPHPLPGFYAAEKLSQVETPKTKKDSWMDRLAGTQPATDE